MHILGPPIEDMRGYLAKNNWIKVKTTKYNACQN